MKIIREKIITSDFGEKESEIFIYQSEKETNKVLFIIKGMYGRHTPFDGITTKLKWDIQFVNRFTKDIHVVCCNTSIRKIDTETDFEDKGKAYLGKTFQQEVGDIQKIIKRVKDIFHNLGIQTPDFYFLGKSFGGTLLLGLQEILDAKAIYMLGSGCGKSENTLKTLLATIPEEVNLLKNISRYNNGKFYFFRGELDDVVPKESQEKIINAVNKDIVEYVVLKGVDHKFEKINGVYSNIPINYLLRKISDSIL